MRITYGIAAGLTAAALLLAGCSSDDDKSATKVATCGDYLQMDKPEKKAAAQEALKAKGYDNPSGLDINAAQGLIAVYCNTTGASNDKVEAALDGFESSQ